MSLFASRKALMNCESCPSYNHGAGCPACLKCPKYQDVIVSSGKRRTIRAECVPQNILEAIEDETQSISNIMEAIRILPPDLAAVTCLIYFGGLTQQQTASLLNISQQMVSKKHKISIEIIRESVK